MYLTLLPKEQDTFFFFFFYGDVEGLEEMSVRTYRPFFMKKAVGAWFNVESTVKSLNA